MDCCCGGTATPTYCNEKLWGFKQEQPIQIHIPTPTPSTHCTVQGKNTCQTYWAKKLPVINLGTSQPHSPTEWSISRWDPDDLRLQTVIPNWTSPTDIPISQRTGPKSDTSTITPITIFLFPVSNSFWSLSFQVNCDRNHGVTCDPFLLSHLQLVITLWSSPLHTVLHICPFPSTSLCVKFILVDTLAVHPSLSSTVILLKPRLTLGLPFLFKALPSPQHKPSGLCVCQSPEVSDVVVSLAVFTAVHPMKPHSLRAELIVFIPVCRQ